MRVAPDEREKGPNARLMRLVLVRLVVAQSLPGKPNRSYKPGYVVAL